MTARDIELALERTHFPARLWLLSPRVSWGMGFEECDLLALSSSGFAHSVEIKVSMGDLRREFKKRKYLFSELRKKHEYLAANSEDRWFRGRWFAIPYLMQDKALPLIPDNFGVFSVHESGQVDRVRLPTVNRKALKWPIERRLALASELHDQILDHARKEWKTEHFAKEAKG